MRLRRAADSNIGAFAVVDAKDDDAIAYYEHHGFIAFASAPRVLFLSIAGGLQRFAP